MTTIVDALVAATAALNNAVQNVLAVRDAIQAQLNAKVAQATAVISNFVNAPVVINVFVDPLGGSDANDGKTVDTPMKSLDTALETFITQRAFNVFLLNDVTLQNRHQTYAIVSIFGGQKTGNPSAPFAVVRRKLGFLGTAANLAPGDLTSPSGFFIGANFRTSSIDFLLPDVPAGATYRSHLTSFFGVTIEVEGPTISVGSQQAGALLGGNHMNCFITPTLAPGAAGHVFDGVPAGSNPNSIWQYNSNLTSA